MKTHRRTASAALLAVAAAAQLSACGEDRPSSPSAVKASDKPSIEMAHATYASVEELASASDAVVLGRVGDVVAHVVDDGGEAQQGTPAGLPMVFNHFSVDKVVRGRVATGDITIGRVDLGVVRYDDMTSIADGASVLLFLKLRPAAQHTYMTEIPGPFYVVTTSSDNGVFDVSGGTARARSLEVRAVSVDGERPAPADDRLSVALKTVETAAANAAVRITP